MSGHNRTSEIRRKILNSMQAFFQRNGLRDECSQMDGILTIKLYRDDGYDLRVSIPDQWIHVSVGDGVTCSIQFKRHTSRLVDVANWILGFAAASAGEYSAIPEQDISECL